MSQKKILDPQATGHVDAANAVYLEHCLNIATIIASGLRSDGCLNSGSVEAAVELYLHKTNAPMITLPEK